MKVVVNTLNANRETLSFGEAIDLCRKGFMVICKNPQREVFYDKETNSLRTSYGAIYIPSQKEMLSKEWAAVDAVAEDDNTRLVKDYLSDYAELLEAVAKPINSPRAASKAEDVRELIKEL